MKRPFVVRFTAGQRLEHLTVMALFVALVLTGFRRSSRRPLGAGAGRRHGRSGTCALPAPGRRPAFAALALGHLGTAALRLVRRRQA
jgi:hypothetical protein